MLTIPSPRKPIGDADMQIDCEFVLDEPVRDLIDATISAGWPPSVVFSALKSVVENRESAYADAPDPSDDP